MSAGGQDVLASPETSFEFESPPSAVLADEAHPSANSSATDAVAARERAIVSGIIGAF